jgi:hypothetical protein
VKELSAKPTEDCPLVPPQRKTKTTLTVKDSVKMVRVSIDKKFKKAYNGNEKGHYR